MTELKYDLSTLIVADRGLIPGNRFLVSSDGYVYLTSTWALPKKKDMKANKIIYGFKITKLKQNIHKRRSS